MFVKRLKSFLMNTKKIDYILIFEGNGKGTKVFQNHLDGHSQIVMIPGTISAYFYYFYKKFYKKKPNEFLKLFNNYFKPLFNFKHNKGSDQIGKYLINRNETFKIDKNIFNKEFLRLYKSKNNNFFDYINSIHYAYAKAAKINLSNKKYFVVHLHNYVLMKNKILNSFPKNTKVIFFTDNQLQRNYFQREYKSFIVPNYLNLPLTRFYFQTFFSHYQSFDYLTQPTLDLKRIKFRTYVIRFSIFNVNRVKFINKTLKVLNLKQDKICMTQTLFCKPFINTYYQERKTGDYIINFFKSFKEDQNTINIGKFLLQDFFRKTNQDIERITSNNYKILLLLRIMVPNKSELRSLYLTFLNINIVKYFIKNLLNECLNFNKKVLNRYKVRPLIHKKYVGRIYLNYFSIDHYLLNFNKNKFLTNKLLLLFFIFLYFFSNLFLFLSTPLIIIINYIIRVKKNLFFYFYNKLNKYKLKKITEII